MDSSLGVMLVEKEDIISQTSRNVFAPVLNSFVLYVINDAMKRGIKKIYFLARDAYFYYLIAERYVKRFDLDIQCKYLYVSRLSLRVPLYHLDTDQALHYITLSGVDVTPTTVMNRSGISEDGKKIFVKKISDYLDIDKDEQIPRHRLNEVKELLRNSEDFNKLLVDSSKKEYLNAYKYLKQEGFGTEEKIAIVDSGWVGSIQDSLNVFRNRFGVNEPLEGYYFGLYEIPAKAEEKYYHSFMFSPKSGLKKKVLFNNCLFECIFSAPHGMTERYESAGDKMVPVLSHVSHQQIDYLNQVERVINTYLDNMVDKYGSFKKICGLSGNPSIQKKIDNELFRFMSLPSKDEAAVFGRLHFSDDVIDYDKSLLANRLSEKDFYDNHFYKRVLLELKKRIFGREYVVNISGWYEGSVMLYAKPSKVKSHLRSYTYYKYYLQYSKRKRWLRKREINEKTKV